MPISVEDAVRRCEQKSAQLYEIRRLFHTIGSDLWKTEDMILLCLYLVFGDELRDLDDWRNCQLGLGAWMRQDRIHSEQAKVN